MKKYFNLLRIDHYVKNVLIFLPLFFGGRIMQINLLTEVIWGFIAFSSMSSVIYIINDLKDIKKDQKHSLKKMRPLASGMVTIKNAIVIAIILFSLSMIIAFIKFNYIGISLIIIYLIMNFLYSFGLKNIPIIDILILVIGYIIRLYFGSVISNIEVSKWLYLTVLAGAFYISLGKRRNEILNQKNNTREVLKMYSESFLDKNMYVFLTLTLVFYSLWTIDPITISNLSLHYLSWTVPFIIVIFLKYSLNIETDKTIDPVNIFWKDKVLLFLICLFLFSVAINIYL